MSRRSVLGSEGAARSDMLVSPAVEDSASGSTAGATSMLICIVSVASGSDCWPGLETSTISSASLLSLDSRPAPRNASASGVLLQHNTDPRQALGEQDTRLLNQRRGKKWVELTILQPGGPVSNGQLFSDVGEHLSPVIDSKPDRPGEEGQLRPSKGTSPGRSEGGRVHV